MGHRHHRRFFVPPADIREGWVAFSAAQAHQIRHVLRLRPGEGVIVFDGTGREIEAALDGGPGALRARVRRERRAAAAGPRILLAQVLPRGAAMDQIVQQATELGAAALVPLLAERSVRQAVERAPRWARIMREAAEQCGRADLPALHAPLPLGQFLAALAPDSPLVVCAPEAGQGLLAAARAVAGASRVTLLVGAEGGLSDAETRQLQGRGALFASLGPHLLRTPTAALAALAVLQAGLSAWGAAEAGERLPGEPSDGEHPHRG
ncbi:MAG: 16S rRNA (uracil(1498)-N(3))-methyltransferase [Candidatus Methylomirabilales bacterium]